MLLYFFVKDVIVISLLTIKSLRTVEQIKVITHKTEILFNGSLIGNLRPIKIRQIWIFRVFFTNINKMNKISEIIESFYPISSIKKPVTIHFNKQSRCSILIEWDHYVRSTGCNGIFIEISLFWVVENEVRACVFYIVYKVNYFIIIYKRMTFCHLWIIALVLYTLYVLFFIHEAIYFTQIFPHIKRSIVTGIIKKVESRKVIRVSYSLKCK